MTNLDDILTISNRRRAEVEALRAEVERLRDERDRFERRVVDYIHALDKSRTEIERLKAAVTDLGVLHITTHTENERLRAALSRLVELGHDDGSAPDDAWKRAFEDAEALCQT